MGRRRFIPAAYALACAVSGCLLYTDPINEPPTVTLNAAILYPRVEATLSAAVRDPDDAADQVALSWRYARKRCDDVTDADWAAAGEVSGPKLKMTPAAHDPVCVRVRARDPHGAEGHGQMTFIVANHAPKATVAVEGLVEGVPLPRFGRVRLTAIGQDQDGDALTYEFSVKRGDVAVALSDCGTAQMPAGCFLPESTGGYEAVVRVSDGRDTQPSAPVRFTVGEDQPPCIAVSDPDLLAAVNIPAGGTRRFEIRQVKDDGHPFPAGPFGETTFYWYVYTNDRGWARLAAQNRSYLDVSTALLFDAIRIGEKAKVRVEVRDPQREAAVAALSAACASEPVCEQPMGCVRSVTWEVTFQ